VRPELVRLPAGEADLVLHVRSEKPVRVSAIRLSGDTAVNPSDIVASLHAVKTRRVIPGIPGIWKGWSKHPAYTRAALEADLARIHSLYFSRGYFDADVRLDRAEISGNHATVHLLVKPGPRYRVRSWHVSAGESIIDRMRNSFSRAELCRCLFDLRTQAEKNGVLDFAARVTTTPAGSGSDTSDPEADVAVTVDRGRSYRIRRIDIEGNNRFGDRIVRANLLLDEGDLLDLSLLRKSLERLNRSSLFETLTENNVVLATDHTTGIVDLRIRVKERRFGSWWLSGPAGPVSFAGPLQFTLASRLPSWGHGALELSSYYASFSLLSYADPFARIFGTKSGRAVLPVFALKRPFGPSEAWTSGFTIAPQLGWRSALLNSGSTHLRERLLPWFGGGEARTILPIRHERSNGDVTLFCEPPPPHLIWLRKMGAIALQAATSVPAF
jgi:hypothetical protein